MGDGISGPARGALCRLKVDEHSAQVRERRAENREANR